MSIYFNGFTVIYFSIFAFIIGTCFGSFLNCLADRYITKESIFKGRSVCDVCSKELAARDLIPIVSYLLNKGRCRYCHSLISIRYPITELLFGILSVLLLLKFDLSVELVTYFSLISCFLVLSLIDLKIYEIPDSTIVISIVFWLFLNLFKSNWLAGILGGFLVAGFLLLTALIMSYLSKKEMMGGGDIKLIFVTGLYLGLIGNLVCLFIACLLGLLFGLILKNNKIPFGPAITISFLIMIFFGNSILFLKL